MSKMKPIYFANTLKDMSERHIYVDDKGDHGEMIKSAVNTVLNTETVATI